MASGASDVIAALNAVFGKLGCRWYLFGAQAVIAHGSPRSTADVDVTVDLGELPVTSLLVALRDAGIVARFGVDEEFIRRARVLPLRHEATQIDVDVLLAGPGLEELFFTRLVSMRLGQVEVPVASAEDLVAMKLLAGRPKDLADVDSIIAAKQDTLDVARVRKTLRVIEEALDRSDLRAALNAALRRCKKPRKR